MIIGPQTQTRNVWNQSYVFKFKLLELFGVEAAIRSIGQLSQNLLKQLIEHLVSGEMQWTVGWFRLDSSTHLLFLVQPHSVEGGDLALYV